jgi:uncharacterized protein YcbK (DUF882 family)
MKWQKHEGGGLRATRRGFLLHAGVAMVAVGAASRVRAADGDAVPRSLSFVHTHTGEQLSATYFRDGVYVQPVLVRLNVLLRDFRTDSVHPVDPQLFDVLHQLQRLAASTEAFHIISAYRSPLTNARLHARSSGVAEHSLHMDGRAIDIRLPGVATHRLAVLARQLGQGGVGFYRVSDFVHVDTGRVRSWGDATVT